MPEPQFGIGGVPRGLLGSHQDSGVIPGTLAGRARICPPRVAGRLSATVDRDRAATAG